MNKELEEAIKVLNRFKSIKILYGNTFAMHLEDLEQLQQAIETVLNYIDNSIPKEVIEEKIVEYKEKIEEAIEEDDDVKEIYYEQEIEILQELLEAK